MNARDDSGLAPQVVVRIGAARIGIPAARVERALAAPHEYTPLPRRHGALLGLLAVDGQPVPVIDIGCWVALANAGGASSAAASAARPDAAATIATPGVAAVTAYVDGAAATAAAANATPTAGAAASADVAAVAADGATLARHRRVLLLRDGARVAALQVDTLEPMAALPASAVIRLCHDDDPDQLFHSAAVLPDSGALLALLDVASLFDLSRSWCDAAGLTTDRATSAANDAAHAADAQTWALIDACDETLALCAEHVAEVLPMPPLQAFMGGSGVALCQWRGGHLAVLPLPRLLGRDDTPAAPLLAVLRLGEHTLGLPVKEVRELRQLPAAPQGVHSEGAGRLPCLTIHDADGATLRLVDSAALFAMHPESALNLEPEPQRGGGERNEQTYMVVDAGGKLALPIAACEEVLQAAPEECVPAPDGGHATLNWRGGTIAVHDLRQPVGSASRRGKVALVVLRTDSAPVALAVDQVVSMIPPGAAELNRLQRAGETVELLILSDDSGSATYRVADPASLLRRVA